MKYWKVIPRHKKIAALPNYREDTSCFGLLKKVARVIDYVAQNIICVARLYKYVEEVTDYVAQNIICVERL